MPNSYRVLTESGNCDESVGQMLKEAEIADLPGFIRQIEAVRQRLIPTRVSERGTILEWREDYEEWEPGHRHISHLYGLHPSEQITVDDTPELARAARETLEQRLSHGGGHTGWSRAWIINHYAKLWDGNTAYRASLSICPTDSSQFPLSVSTRYASRHCPNRSRRIWLSMVTPIPFAPFSPPGRI